VRARRQLKEYLARRGVFEPRCLAAWWEDADVDQMATPFAERPVGLSMLWRRSEVKAVELAYVMHRLSVIYPSQSAVERKNALVKFTGGDTLRNALRLESRIQLAKSADYYRRDMPQQSRKARHNDDDEPCSDYDVQVLNEHDTADPTALGLTVDTVELAYDDAIDCFTDDSGNSSDSF